MASGPAWMEATAATLAALAPEEWTVLHDVRWPGRGCANVDHVVIGPSGVFVIDVRAWDGRISVRGDELRQNGRVREMAVVGAAEAAQQVARVAGSVDPRHVKPVLCFVRDEQLVGWTYDVLVCSTATLLTMLLSRPTVLTPVQRGKVALELDASLRTATPRPAPVSVSVSVPPGRTASGWLSGVFAR